MAQMFPFQEEAVADLLGGKHIVTAGTGTGKSVMLMSWASKLCKRKKKDKLLIITTASKSKLPQDFTDDGDKFCPEWRDSISSLSVISWHKAHQWTKDHARELGEYVYAFDENHRCRQGNGSLMGRAFLTIARATSDWAGFTATPGENWLHFLPYFVATGKVKNKTAYLRDYATVQTFKGYPEIVAWRNESVLKGFWAQIATTPDTDAVMRQLPPETHHMVRFKKPSGYDKVLKTRETADGELLDTSMALCHHLRQLCFTKDKQQWLADYFEDMDSSVVVFYNYVEDGNKIAELAQKKGRKTWRIDGSHKEIPYPEVTGEKDVVICHWQSGSEALNLQHIPAFISVSPTYSYTQSLQGRGRIKRVGQKHKMNFWYLLCENSIEADIYDALKHKRDFSSDTWMVEKGLERKE